MKKRLWVVGLALLLAPVLRAAGDESAAQPLPEVAAEDAANHIGERCVVVGKVVLTKNIGSMCFLNFHLDYRDHFTAVIKRKNFDRFPEPPETLYADKIVKITGEIIEFKGKPEIIVTGPEQIRIVDESGAEIAGGQPASAAGTPEKTTPPSAGSPQKSAAASAAHAYTGVVKIATYNVYNLFDDYDDPYHADEGTRPKPADELEHLAATIRQINPDVIALEEVENRGMLTEFNRTLLGDMGYTEVVDFDGNDRRGIDVAVLSRLPVGPVTSYRHVRYKDPHGNPARFRRDFLRVRIEPPGADSFDVFVMHLKSKHGGAASDVIRRGEAGEARAILDGILQHNPKARFVVCGDFNDTYESGAVQALVGTGPGQLVSFFEEIPSSERITFNKDPYRSMIDFILASPAMAQRYQKGSYSIRPGSVATSGSDHNPVCAQFSFPARKAEAAP